MSLFLANGLASTDVIASFHDAWGDLVPGSRVSSPWEPIEGIVLSRQNGVSAIVVTRYFSQGNDAYIAEFVKRAETGDSRLCPNAKAGEPIYFSLAYDANLVVLSKTVWSKCSDEPYEKLPHPSFEAPDELSEHTAFYSSWDSLYLGKKYANADKLIPDQQILDNGMVAMIVYQRSHRDRVGRFRAHYVKRATYLDQRYCLDGMRSTSAHYYVTFDSDGRATRKITDFCASKVPDICRDTLLCP